MKNRLKGFHHKGALNYSERGLPDNRNTPREGERNEKRTIRNLLIIPWLR